MSPFKKIRIQSIREEARGFKSFFFEEGHGIEYKAGQYLTLVHKFMDQEIRRSYSITSCPELHEQLAIGIKRTPNGIFSRMMIDDAQPGDELITTGAGGLFVLPPDIKKYKQIFFMAAGSGITPIYSLLKSILYAHPLIKCSLFYSNSSPSTSVFRKELTELENAHSNQFQIEWLFSNTPDLSRARLYRDLLMQLLNRFSVSGAGETLYYLCGPYSYMRMITFVLQEMGIASTHIRKENFITAQAPPPTLVLPADTKSYNAIINYSGRRYEVPVHYPDSILAAARKSGLNLPFSCETGRCGNCVATCNKGTVWLAYNEVLTEEDLQNKLVLTCVGHPVGGEVELTVNG